MDYWPWPTIVQVRKSIGCLSGYSYFLHDQVMRYRNLIALTMEMIKEGAIRNELKHQQGNFNFKAATIESHYVLVADQLFNCNLV